MMHLILDLACKKVIEVSMRHEVSRMLLLLLGCFTVSGFTLFLWVHFVFTPLAFLENPVWCWRAVYTDSCCSAKRE